MRANYIVTYTWFFALDIQTYTYTKLVQHFVLFCFMGAFLWMGCNFGSSWHFHLPSLKFSLQVCNWSTQAHLAKQCLNTLYGGDNVLGRAPPWTQIPPNSVMMGPGSKQPWEPPTLCHCRNACLTRKRCPVANTWVTAGSDWQFMSPSLELQQMSSSWPVDPASQPYRTSPGSGGNFKTSLAVTKCLVLHKLSKQSLFGFWRLVPELSWDQLSPLCGHWVHKNSFQCG